LAVNRTADPLPSALMTKISADGSFAALEPLAVAARLV